MSVSWNSELILTEFKFERYLFLVRFNTGNLSHYLLMHDFLFPTQVGPAPSNIVVRASAEDAGGRGWDPRPLHTKDVKIGRFALLYLALMS